MSYLMNRGITLGSIGKFNIGYVDDNEFDAFYHRLVFPIFDQYGKLHSMQGRAMYDWAATNKPKYYHGKFEAKGRILYGLYENLKTTVQKNTVVITEGPFDVCALSQIGIPSVACLGTSFSEEHCFLLRCYCDTIYVWLDSDNAGDKAAINLINKLKEYEFNIYRVIDDKYKDVSDRYVATGREGTWGKLDESYRLGRIL